MSDETAIGLGYLGRAYLAKGELSRAIPTLEQAVQEAVRLASGNLNAGQALEHLMSCRQNGQGTGWAEQDIFSLCGRVHHWLT